MIREDCSRNNKNVTFFEYSSCGETVTDVFIVKLKIYRHLYFRCVNE